MTRAEVMAMGDDELCATALQLAGWELAPGPSFGRCGLTAEEREKSPGYCWRNGDQTRQDMPDYPRDIAAAWGLWEKIPLPCGIERGYEKAYGVGPVGTHVGFGVLPLDHDEDDVYAENVWALTAPRAITRAFVFAMSNEAH